MMTGLGLTDRLCADRPNMPLDNVEAMLETIFNYE